MTRTAVRDESGVMTVLFALVVGLIMIVGSLVITVGSWYTHARQLQTKVDAAALAGGGAWSFPCTPQADQTIADSARRFFGEHTTANGLAFAGDLNQQIGGVEGNQLYLALNQPDWWDDAFAGADFAQPAGSVCNARTLDVRATESDSPLLWGWLPFSPDIKKRARVEVQGARGVTDVLPISVRVPQPVSSAAVVYDEETGEILTAQTFDEATGLGGLPPGLHGYTTRLAEQPGWIGSLPSHTGVAIALSFVPACDLSGESPCFDVEGFTTVDALCNQGTTSGIATCYAGSGEWPNRTVTAGLHFMRGFGTASVGRAPPQLRGAHLSNLGCDSGAYFNAAAGSCAVRLEVDVDLGSVLEAGGGGDDDDGGGRQQTRKAENVEVRYALVRADGSSFCDDYGTGCRLKPESLGATGTVTYRTTGESDSRDVPLTDASGANALAIQVRVKRSSVSPNPGSCGVRLRDFHRNCAWFHLADGIVGTSAPSASQILDEPVQRAFMGSLDRSGPVRWLRVAKDLNCDGEAEETGGEAATHPELTPLCVYVDMGLEGGTAKDQDEPPIAFTEGTGASQMGSVECDPAFTQGQILIDGVIQGCSPYFARNEWDSFPLCPGQAQFFELPKAAPFDDWPPFDCVKTRPTGSMNQVVTGLNVRIFGVPTNPQCPPDDDEFVPGRNYWHRENNAYTGSNFAWDRNTPTKDDDLTNRIDPEDPRLVTLFVTPYESFTGSGQEVFPIVSLGSFYITGYGRLNGNGGFQGGGPDDPCSDGGDSPEYAYAGNDPPPDLNMSGASASGVAVWGHFIKTVTQSGATLGGNGTPCEDGLDPCVAVLVE